MVESQAGPQLMWITLAELVDAVRSERVRFPSPGFPSAADTARVLNAIHSRYPQRSLLLWQDPSDGPDAGTWLLDGGDLVSALLSGLGELPDRPSRESVWFDADTDEVVAWGQRPDDLHELLKVGPLLAAEDIDRHLAVEQLAGSHADRARAFGRALREHAIPVQVVDLPKAELPRLFAHLPGRRGVSLVDIDPPAEALSGPSPAFFAWRGGAKSLVTEARTGGWWDLPEPDVWRALLVTEGRDPDQPYDELAESAGLPEDGRSAVRAVREAQSFLRGVVGYPNAGLAPETRSLAALARFLRVFPNVERPVWPLLRRWVWRAALADHGIDLTPEALSMIREDPADSAVRLLERTPTPALAAPGRSSLDPGSRRGRLVLLGLASLHPRGLLSGVLLDIERVRPRSILPDATAEPANLVLQDLLWHQGADDDLRHAIETSTDHDVLASHGIDADSVALLRVGDDEGFLARRAVIVDRAVLDHWTRMTEPSARTRRPVGLLFGDDDGV